MPRAKLFIYSLLGDNKNLNLKEKISKTELIGLYRDMALIREFENETYRQYMQKQIKGFLHVYSGEEAIAVGVVAEVTVGAVGMRVIAEIAAGAR